MNVTLHELQTVYGVKDLYDFLEIIAVSSSNSKVAARRARENR